MPAGSPTSLRELPMMIGAPPAMRSPLGARVTRGY